MKDQKCLPGRTNWPESFVFVVRYRLTIDSGKLENYSLLGIHIKGYSR